MLICYDLYYEEIGFEIAKKLNAKILPMSHKIFPDGETYIRFPNPDVIEGETIVFIGNAYPNQNNGIIRALFTVSTLKDLGAKKVIIVFPYLPYSRQDKRFLPGECISAKVLVDLLIKAGADIVMTIDVHNEKAFEEFGAKFVNISSMNAWAKYFKKINKSYFLVAPDKGRMKVVGKLAEILSVDATSFIKERDLTTGKILKHAPSNEEELMKLAKENEIAIIWDDILATGGTVANVSKQLRKIFNGEIWAAFTHVLMLPGAIQRITMAGVSKIIATNTIRNTFAEVNISQLLANEVQKYA